jgi:hypothetical protein
MTGAVAVAGFESFPLAEKCTKYDLSTYRLTKDSRVTGHDNHFPTLSLKYLFVSLTLTT